jgi:hypothetical protein
LRCVAQFLNPLSNLLQLFLRVTTRQYQHATARGIQPADPMKLGVLRIL